MAVIICWGKMMGLEIDIISIVLWLIAGFLCVGAILELFRE